MYSYGPPHMAKQKQDDQLEHTYSSYVRIRDVALKTCEKRWMIGKSGERGVRDIRASGMTWWRWWWWWWFLLSFYHILIQIETKESSVSYELATLCQEVRKEPRDSSDTPAVSHCTGRFELSLSLVSNTSVKTTWYACWESLIFVSGDWDRKIHWLQRVGRPLRLFLASAGLGLPPCAWVTSFKANADETKVFGAHSSTLKLPCSTFQYGGVLSKINETDKSRFSLNELVRGAWLWVFDT